MQSYLKFSVYKTNKYIYILKNDLFSFILNNRVFFVYSKLSKQAVRAFCNENLVFVHKTSNNFIFESKN